MRHTLIITFLSLLSLSSCMVGVQGNGVVKEANRDVQAFENISISGMFEVHLKQGDGNSLKIVADENLHELIDAHTEGNTLYISTSKSIGRAEELDLYIISPKLERVNLSGAVSLKSSNEIEGDFFRLESSGAAEVDMELEVDELEIELSGAAEVELKGEANYLSLETSGASELKLFDLEVDKARVHTSGAAELQLNVEDDLQIDASGAADIRYRGNPNLSRTDLSGAASLKKE